MNWVYAATANSGEAPVSLNTLDIIFGAGAVVQLTLLCLMLFSICTWAIIFFKWGTVRRCFRNTDRFLDIFLERKKHGPYLFRVQKIPRCCRCKSLSSGLRRTPALNG
jgi:hypothetical protein